MNPFSLPPACSACNDTRLIARYPTARKDDLLPCERCGLLVTDEYERFRRDAWSRSHSAPTICELDLTPEEFVIYERMRAEHPNVSKLTVLSWTEGQRYDPSKDQEFLNQARDEFRKWRDARDKADTEYRATHPYSTGDGRLKKNP